MPESRQHGHNTVAMDDSSGVHPSKYKGKVFGLPAAMVGLLSRRGPWHNTHGVVQPVWGQVTGKFHQHPSPFVYRKKCDTFN